MNRRHLLQTLGVAGAALLLPKLGRAEELPPPPAGIRIVSEITRNHGHDFALSPEEALRLLRQTRLSGAPVVISIQGASGHPHSVELAFEDLLVLFADGQILETSTVDAGHSHDVTVRMEV
jgi:hypothetical protein